MLGPFVGVFLVEVVILLLGDFCFPEQICGERIFGGDLQKTSLAILLEPHPDEAKRVHCRLLRRYDHVPPL